MCVCVICCSRIPPNLHRSTRIYNIIVVLKKAIVIIIIIIIRTSTAARYTISSSLCNVSLLLSLLSLSSSSSSLQQLYIIIYAIYWSNCYFNAFAHVFFIEKLSSVENYFTLLPTINHNVVGIVVDDLKNNTSILYLFILDGFRMFCIFLLYIFL
jgi:hypothetical protein